MIVDMALLLLVRVFVMPLVADFGEFSRVEATSPLVVALGIELSAAALSGPLGQPALDYHGEAISC